MKTSLVSIVLPTYNGERYLRESLDSVLSQTYSDWELIAVNDCSTDGTAEILKEYAEKDARIRILTNETNQRLPRSLNIGFREARGKYLTWTSDDNYYLPEAIGEMVRALDADPVCPMVCADMDFIAENGTVLRQAPHYDDYLIWAKDLVGACFLYRREALTEVGEYDPSLVYVEDYAYWLAIRSRMGEIRRVPRLLYRYRFHEASLTSTKKHEVICQRARLRLMYAEEIFRSYRGDRQILCEIYYDFLMSGNGDEGFLRRLRVLLPEVAKEVVPVPADKAFWVFGAGEIGGLARKLLKSRCMGFVDNDPAKQDTEIDGLPVFSLASYLDAHARVPLLIAIGVEHIYEVIDQVLRAGAVRYFTYATLYAQTRADREKACEDGAL